MRASILRIAGVWLLVLSAATAHQGLPVYIEDSHAGTFYWIVQNLDLNREYELVLIDAHNDASEILGSDRIREAVLQATADGRLTELAREWRSHGAIQSFNWIEPLMPRPIKKVWWVPRESLSADEILRKRDEVRRQINAHQMAVPRVEGDLGRSYDILGLDRLETARFESPVLATVDLDYFAPETDSIGIRSKVERVLGSVLELPHLRALTLAISRPYLSSRSQADTLLYESLRYLTRVVNADIRFEPFSTTGTDRSEKASEYYRARTVVPRYDVEHASVSLRSLVLQNADSIAVNEEKPAWERLLEDWRSDPHVPRLVLCMNGRVLSDGDEPVIPADASFSLKLTHDEMSAGAMFRWKVIVPSAREFNLIEEAQGFAEGAPRFLVYGDAPVRGADGRVEIGNELLTPFLDKSTGLGTLRVYCEVVRGTDTYVSNVVRLSRYRGDGYVGKLTEIFNLPYVYGSALLRVGGQISADARYGADCSHFIIYGRRREGWPVPYVNPKELIPYLRELAEVREVRDGIAYDAHGPVRITPDMVRRGVLLHFGKHVAAVYSVADEAGVLNERTLVVHQLEGFPEITTFSVMSRRYKEIRVMMFR